jgi:hypothetical protein
MPIDIGYNNQLAKLAIAKLAASFPYSICHFFFIYFFIPGNHFSTAYASLAKMSNHVMIDYL